MTTRTLITLPLLSLLACGPAQPQTGETSTTDETSTTEPSAATTTTAGTTTLPTTTAPGETSTSTTAGPTTTAPSTGVDFVARPDTHDPMNCDIFAQDCEPGQKCVPWGPEGSSWRGTKCVDVTGDGAPGDPCTAPEGPVAGIDDCDATSICWDVDDNNSGTCIAQCTGTLDAPMCPTTFCSLNSDGTIALCFPGCDPLIQDCPGDDLCLPDADDFICVLDASGDQGQMNDPCGFPNACDKGHLCLAPADVSAACDPQADGCCTPFCELPDGPCPNPDQECTPWYEPMQQIPPGNESIGVCRIPA